MRKLLLEAHTWIDELILFSALAMAVVYGWLDKPEASILCLIFWAVFRIMLRVEKQ